jgi:hypothetical protein
MAILDEPKGGLMKRVAFSAACGWKIIIDFVARSMAFRARTRREADDRMDKTTRTEKHEQPAYKTSKQVQAWFLGRSRDRWKQKCAELRVESKRLHKSKPGERLPGSTEVLESCFGRFKILEKDQAQGGFTSLLLGFGAFFSEATIEKVLEAMSRVPTKAVWQWCAEHLGKTLFSKRKEVYTMARSAQPKPADAIA